jgi:hypothetical protein
MIIRIIAVIIAWGLLFTIILKLVLSIIKGE